MVVDHLVSRKKKHLENKTACCKQTFDYRTLCQCFSLTFFPPCFSTMSVLSGKWSSWGVLEPPPLGIVQLSPRQASFTLPLHRHQPSGTKGEKKRRWGRLATDHYISLKTFTHCQTMQPLAVHQALYFQPLYPYSTGRAVCEGGQQAGLQLRLAKSLAALQAEHGDQARSAQIPLNMLGNLC